MLQEAAQRFIKEVFQNSGSRVETETQKEEEYLLKMNITNKDDDFESSLSQIDWKNFSEKHLWLFLKLDDYIEINDINILSIEGVEKVRKYGSDLLDEQDLRTMATLHMANEIYIQMKQQELLSQLYALLNMVAEENLHEAIENACKKYNFMLKIKLQLYIYVEKRLYHSKKQNTKICKERLK